MELLCPTCQKKLTIPDHFAGQTAKCPECGNTFTAPTLPPASGAFIPPPPIPPAPASVAVGAPAPPPDGHAPAPAPVLYTPPPPAAGAHPDFAAQSAVSAAPSVSAAPAPQDYTHRRSLWVSPRFLRWVAVAAVLVVFVLSFFPWVGVYPGRVGVVTQSAWQAGFGGESIDKDFEKKLPEFMSVPPAEGEKEKKQAERPGASGMTLLYVLLLVPTFLLTIAVAVWDVLPLNLPAGIQRLKPWRWGIVAAIALLAFVFLVLQLFTGFSLENRVQTNVERSVKDLQARVDTTPEKEVAMLRGIGLSPLHRTAALDWVVWLHLLAVVCALLVFWTERRGARPLPRIDVLW